MAVKIQDLSTADQAFVDNALSKILRQVGNLTSLPDLSMADSLSVLSLSVGPFGATPNANGLSIGSGLIQLQPADATHPGAVSTASQTFAGIKIFGNGISVTGNASISGTLYCNGNAIGDSGGGQRVTFPGGTNYVKLMGAGADNAAFVGVISDSFVAISTVGAKIHSFRNAGVEKAWVDFNGRFGIGAPATAPTDANIANSQISFYLDEVGNNLKVRVCYSNGTYKTATIALV